MSERGLENFKSWPIAKVWFYPRYGHGFSYATIDATYKRAKEVNPSTKNSWLSAFLTGGQEASRDFDVVRLAWDQQRWPFDLTGHGESRLGTPLEYYKLTGAEHGWTRPYLNYLLCLTALSKHVDAAPKAFLEIGGGYGVLGEILLSRDSGARYVNLDIPPLVTVSSYYLKTLFGDRVRTYDGVLPRPVKSELDHLRGAAELADQGCPRRLRRLRELVLVPGDGAERRGALHRRGRRDRSQPRRVAQLAQRQAEGRSARRPPLGWGHRPGDVELIIDLFGARGYQLQGRYNTPLIHSAGELVV